MGKAYKFTEIYGHLQIVVTPYHFFISICYEMSFILNVGDTYGFKPYSSKVFNILFEYWLKQQWN